MIYDFFLQFHFINSTLYWPYTIPISQIICFEGFTMERGGLVLYSLHRLITNYNSTPVGHKLTNQYIENPVVPYIIVLSMYEKA